MSVSVMDYQNFLWRLLRALSDLRLSNDPHGFRTDCWGEYLYLVNRGLREGYVSAVEFIRLHRLARNAALYSADLRFPDARNAGPYMPTSVWFKRHNAEIGSTVVKLGARESTNDRSCAASPAPAASQGLRLPGLLCTQSTGQDVRLSPAPACRQLRLLCVLAEPQLGASTPRYLPVHTMHRVPPRAMVKGKWSQPRYAGLYLRETHAAVPTGEVLERCERHRQTHALRAAARTVRTGGVIA